MESCAGAAGKSFTEKEFPMRLMRLISGMGLSLALAANSALAADPTWCCPPATPVQPGQPMPGQATPGQAMPGQPGAAGQQPADSAFAQAPAAGTGAEGTGNPNIMGDFLRGSTPAKVFFNTSTSFSSSNSSRGAIPIGGGPLKIAENENVRPQDRVFLNWNGYSNIFPGVNNSDIKAVRGQVNYDYETVGFESTCFGGNASFGVRLPVFELEGQRTKEQTHIGDISLVSKFLFASDGADAVSGGLVLTIPTGLKTVDLHGHTIHSTVWQPWLGVETNISDDLYFQGFTSLAIPSVREDATILFLDGAIGYWAYRGDGGGCLTGIVPTSEIHINWPWTNRSEHDTTHAINVPASVDLTEGVHFIFGRCTLQLGISFCVTGPNIYDFEGIAQLNMHF
jgi:hypothetical protein